MCQSLWVYLKKSATATLDAKNTMQTIIVLKTIKDKNRIKTAPKEIKKRQGGGGGDQAR